MLERDRFEQILAIYIPTQSGRITYEDFLNESRYTTSEPIKDKILKDGVKHDGIRNTRPHPLVIAEFNRLYGPSNFYQEPGGNALFSAQFYAIFSLYLITKDINIALSLAKEINYDISRVGLNGMPYDKKKVGYNLMVNRNTGKGCSGCLGILLIPVIIMLMISCLSR